MNGKYILPFSALLFLSACSSTGTPELSGLTPEAQAKAITRYGGTYKVGNPYKIMGKWYYPKEDYAYSEVGMASWYGEDFHAKTTANGEKYDMNTLTAAHRTLPLPSIVRVTNLENGRSLVLRVNDRGPYAKDRIIDISKRGAQLLGYQTKGIAKVRVEILEKESKALKMALLGEKVPAISTPLTTPSVVAAIEPNLVQKSLPNQEKTSWPQTKGTFVQAGAFTQEHLANGLRERLSLFGQSFVIPAIVGGAQFYRVRIGPLRDNNAAAAMLLKVQNYGISDARLIYE